MPAMLSIPRYQKRRQILRFLSQIAFHLLCDFRVENSENIPREGPVIVVGNHFHYADPVVFVAILPWQTEYIAGTLRPSAPWIVRRIPDAWVTLNVHRGNASTEALKGAAAVLGQGGLLGVFPEAGAWASVLRRARPGVPFLAATTGAPLLPIGIEGMTEIFPALRRGKRATVTVRVGRPFGPFNITSRGRERRADLEAIGHQIMGEIAALIPPERHGVYSSDPVLQREAEAVAAFPFD